MPVRIITIEREYGCGAPAIAEQLADELGWKLWDNSLTDEIARIAHVTREAAQRCDEKIDPLLYRLAKTFWRGSNERAMTLPDPGAFDSECMVPIMQRVIEQAAADGNCVIVGRGAPYFLRERTDAFHVFLFATREEKLRRLLRKGVDRREAEELIDTVDHDRAAFIKRYFGKDWPNRHLYDLMINTGIGNDRVISTILTGIQEAQGVAKPAA